MTSHNFPTINGPEPMGVRRGRCHVDTPRTKRQYVWEKTGGFCWYCEARLYLREDADDELKKRLVFTVEHLHPRVHGGRGRANKVPACKYCNSHKRLAERRTISGMGSGPAIWPGEKRRSSGLRDQRRRCDLLL